MRFLHTLPFAAAVVSAVTFPGSPDMVLRPINVVAFESAVSGISRRAVEAEKWADLTPAEQALLVYGTPGSNGQLLLANMTLIAPSGLPIVMMERLEGLTAAVDCSAEGDGELGVTWKDDEAYKRALKSWDWINEDKELQFLMIMNHDGCGPDNERNAYRVTNVETDEVKRITKLKAVEAPWKDITGTYSMDFGRATLRPGAAKRLGIRGWKDFVNKVKKVGDKVKDVAKDVGDAVKGVGQDIGDLFESVGDADLSNSVEFDVSGGQQGVRKNIFTDPLQPPRLIVDCANCFIAGKFKVAGSLKVDNFKIIDLSLTVAPSGFSATAEIDATLAQNFSPDELNSLTTVGTDKKFNLLTLDRTTDLIEVPVPGAGLVVPKIFSMGLIASVEAGFTLGFKGKIGFTVGVTATLPDSALIKLNMADLESSSATGFEGAKVDPVFKVNNASASIDATIFFRPKFAIKCEVTSVGEVSADIKAGLPQINANAAAEYNENGVCEGSTEKTGLRFKVNGVLNLVVGVTGTIVGFGGRLLEKTLVGYELFKMERCVPFVVPALEGSVSASSSLAPSSSSISMAPSSTANTASSSTTAASSSTTAASSSTTDTVSPTASASSSTVQSPVPISIKARAVQKRDGSRVYKPVNIQW
ncbi:hypothetical protein K440DRAFT_164112 [Wilcoxina mikolae CBS 423.85]|nr:hypothetical protein K440DRAFT_164112 [Wilcoxina mikolae CBS 423.85]